MGVLSNKLWIICQTECELAYQVISPVLGDVKVENDKEDHLEDCVDLEFLKDYFQWEVDLGSLYKKWSRKDKNFSKISPDFLGVRMLRQDPVENLFSFICSSNNNIQRYTFWPSCTTISLGNNIIVLYETGSRGWWKSCVRHTASNC